MKMCPVEVNMTLNIDPKIEREFQLLLQSPLHRVCNVHRRWMGVPPRPTPQTDAQETAESIARFERKTPRSVASFFRAVRQP